MHSPNWIRLQKALAVEADRDYPDLIGNQYRFSEFLCLSFGKPPAHLPITERRRWQEMAVKFAAYPELDRSERQHLVADARNFLSQQQKLSETPPQPPQPKLPRTKTIAKSTTKSYTRATSLDQSLSQVVEIGRNSRYLERLGLVTVRDLLFYYPRNHLDYARQVTIAHLVPGETVTIIGTVKSCKCFTSTKKKQLTIFELVIQDATGKIRLNHFLTGNRYSSRAWQERYKRQYPEGSIVAASGLVKEKKWSNFRKARTRSFR